MKSLSDIEFKKEAKFLVNNILQGFEEYTSGIINAESYESLDGFLKECNRENEDVIVDYYGNRIEEKFYLNIMDNLDEDEVILLNRIKKDFNSKHIYFKNLNEKEISLINKLSINCILFSTYNILDDEVIIWSNYEKKFPIFFRDNRKIEKYKEICDKYNLIISDINIK